MTRETVSKFLKVTCDDCGNEQTTFNKPSTEVRCIVCGSVLATPRGGLGIITAEEIEDVEEVA